MKKRLPAPWDYKKLEVGYELFCAYEDDWGYRKIVIGKIFEERNVLAIIKAINSQIEDPQCK